jgi:predicted DNA-binding transcriptional regulator AlpA
MPATALYDEPHLDVFAVARRLRIEPATLRGWCRTNRGPRPVKIGGRWRWSEAEVQRYLIEGERAAS